MFGRHEYLTQRSARIAITRGTENSKDADKVASTNLHRAAAPGQQTVREVRGMRIFAKFACAWRHKPITTEWAVRGFA
jgi:hypothetical protein